MAMVLQFEHVSESPGRLVKTVGWTPRASDSIGLWGGLSIGISHKLPGDDDADVTGQGSHFEKHCPEVTELLGGRTKPHAPSTSSPVSQLVKICTEGTTPIHKIDSTNHSSKQYHYFIIRQLSPLKAEIMLFIPFPQSFPHRKAPVAVGS